MPTPFTLYANLKIQEIEGLAALKKDLAGITSGLSINGGGAGGGAAGPALNLSAVTAGLDGLGAAAALAAKTLQQIAVASESVIAAFGKVASSATTAPAVASAAAPQAAVQAAVSQAAGAFAAATSDAAKKISQATSDFPFSTTGAIVPAFKPGASAPFGGGSSGPGVSPQDLEKALEQIVGKGFAVAPNSLAAGPVQGPQFPFPFTPANLHELQIPGIKTPSTSIFAAQQQAQFLAQQQQEVVSSAQSSLFKDAGGVKPGQGFIQGAPVQFGEITQASKKAQVAMDEISSSAAKAGKSTTVGMTQAATATEKFADQILLATKRNAAFFIGAIGPLALIAGFKKANDEVIEFDRQITRLDQTLDPTRADLAELRNLIIDLSVKTGTATDDLAKVAVTLAQAGFTGDRLKESLSELANIPLLASFDGIDQAAGGLIAVFGQFKDKAGDARDIFDRLNEVSNKYAITASDLIEAVKRGGGAFSALGGSIDEYIALVTAAKQTTQESAETIGTGLRTIAGKIGKPETLDFLKSIGVQTTDAKGKILSLFELLRQTAQVFQNAPTDKRRDIAEELGGLRQLGRTISILDNFDLVVKVLNTSLTSSGSVAQDVEKGLQSLSKQFELLKAKATELVLALAPDVFIPFLKFLAEAGTGALKLASALAPLLKVLLAVGAASAAVAGAGLLGTLGSKLLSFAASKGGAGGGVLGGGLIGSLGLGSLATGQARIPFNVPSGGQNVFPFAEPGTLGRAASQFAAGGAVRELASRPGVQVLGLAGVATAGAAATEFAAKLTGASDATATFAGNLVRNSAILVGVLTALQRASVGQTLAAGGFPSLLGGTKGLGGAFIKGFAGFTTLFLTAAVTASHVAEQELDHKVDEIGAAIKSIKVPDPNNIPEVREATGDLASQVRRTADETVATYSGFFGFLAKFGKKFSDNVVGGLSGDIERIKSPAVDIEKRVNEAVGQNIQLLQAILESSIREGGNDFRGVFFKNIESAFGQVGLTKEFADKVAQNFLSKSGGFSGIAQVLKKVQSEIEQSKLGDQARRAAHDLATIIVPPELFSQLQVLGKAVEQVSKRIDASISTFESTSAASEGLNAPKIPTTVDREAARKLLAGGALTGLPSATPQFTANSQIVQQALDLATRFSGALADAAQKARSDTTKLNPLEGEGLTKSIDSFFTKQNVPQELRGKLQLLFQDIAEAIKAGAALDTAGLNKEKINELLKKRLGDVLPTSENISDIVGSQVEAALRLISKRGDFEQNIFNRQVNTPQTPESQFRTTQDLLNKAGVGLNVSQPRDILNDSTLLDRLNQQLTSTSDELGKITGALFRATSTGEVPTVNGKQRTIPELLKDFEALRTRSLTLQAGIESLTKSIGGLDQLNQTTAGDQKKAAEVLQEFGTSTQKLLETLREMGDRLPTTGVEGIAGARQSNDINRTLGLNADVIEAAKAVLAKPGDKDLVRNLDVKLLDFQKALLAVNQSRLNNRDLGFSKDVEVGVSEGMSELIDHVGNLRTQTAVGAIDIQDKDDARKAQKLTEALENLITENQKRIAQSTGLLDDPFRTKDFRAAVDKFTTSIELFSKGAVPQPNIDAQRRADLSKLSAADSGALERSLFAGQTRQQIVGLANSTLAGPQNPIGGGINSLSSLLGINDGSTRDIDLGRLAAAITDQLKTTGPTDQQTPFRIAQVLRSQGRVGLDQFQISDDIRKNAELFGGELRPTPRPEDLLKDRTIKPDLINPQSSAGQQDKLSDVATSLGKIADSLAGTNEAAAQSIRDAAKQIEVPGLTENAEATKDNVAGLHEVSVGQDALATTLRDTAKAMREGVGVKFETTQEVTVKVDGLTEEIESQLRPVLEDAVRQVATSIVRRTLIDLASNSDTEGARAFQAAARNLA